MSERCQALIHKRDRLLSADRTPGFPMYWKAHQCSRDARSIKLPDLCRQHAAMQLRGIDVLRWQS